MQLNQIVLRLALKQLRGYRKFAGILVAAPDFIWIWWSFVFSLMMWLVKCRGYLSDPDLEECGPRIAPSGASQNILLIFNMNICQSDTVPPYAVTTTKRDLISSLEGPFLSSSLHCFQSRFLGPARWSVVLVFKWCPLHQSLPTGQSPWLRVLRSNPTRKWRCCICGSVICIEWTASWT